jgi:hypothetical protein
MKYIIHTLLALGIVYRVNRITVLVDDYRTVVTSITRYRNSAT